MTVLDAKDKRIMRLNIRLYLLEDECWAFGFEGTSKEMYQKEAIAELSRYFSGYEARETLLDRETEKLFQTMLEALEEPHYGDCTKASCACARCHAEEFAEIKKEKL